jgi:hypothetical protein
MISLIFTSLARISLLPLRNHPLEETMIRFVKACVAATAILSAPAFATLYVGSYKLLDLGNYSPMHNSNPYFSIVSWNATLTVNNTGNSTLIGTGKGSNGTNYNISMSFFDTYIANGNRYWGDFTGTLTAFGASTPIITFADVSGHARSKDDAVIGLGAVPYNNGVAGGNTSNLEFGFWGSKPPGGPNAPRNSDVNVRVECISGGGANTNGTCKPGGSVPVPATAALLGLGLLAAASVRRKRA